MELNPTEQDRRDAERHVALLKRYADSSFQDILTDLFFLIQLAMFRGHMEERKLTEVQAALAEAIKKPGTNRSG